MARHVIYYFSGTGNSLKTALTVQKALGDCSVVPMATLLKTSDNTNLQGLSEAHLEEVPATELSDASPALHESVGFVFPCYAGGVPPLVRACIATLDPTKQGAHYMYGIVTYGAMLGASLAQLQDHLANQGLKLDYAAGLKSFANNVLLYDMSSKVAEKTAQTKSDLQPIITDILQQRSGTIKQASSLARVFNRAFGQDAVGKDHNYTVLQTACISCGQCAKVCPVHNIVMEEGRPVWQGHCEHCLACIQWCPKKAINYGEKTQKRGRYTHPEITSRMFIDYLNGAGIVSQDSSFS